MTTNNHPAHGPVSLDRLHQIREILSKAAAQSDGGNLGYAMADAVKVINGVISAEPVGEVSEQRDGLVMDGTVDLGGASTHRIIKGASKMKRLPIGTKFYITPPVPVVPDECKEAPAYVKALTKEGAYIYGFNGCRAAMLQAGNHTEQHLDMVESGWIPVSERMPEDGEHVIVFHPKDGVMQITFFFAYGKWWDAAEDDGGLSKSYFTHWMPLPAPPQQEG
ncbi:DUF551 domain-containing protein [Salmonella enterica]